MLSTAAANLVEVAPQGVVHDVHAGLVVRTLGGVALAGQGQLGAVTPGWSGVLMVLSSAGGATTVSPRLLGRTPERLGPRARSDTVCACGSACSERARWRSATIRQPPSTSAPASRARCWPRSPSGSAATSPPDALVDLVWGEDPPRGAHGTLHSYLSGVRRVLEPGLGPREKPEVLLTSDHGYRLALGREHVDAHRFADEVRTLHRSLAPLAASSPPGRVADWPTRAEISRHVDRIEELLALWTRRRVRRPPRRARGRPRAHVARPAPARRRGGARPGPARPRRPRGGRGRHRAGDGQVPAPRTRLGAARARPDPLGSAGRGAGRAAPHPVRAGRRARPRPRARAARARAGRAGPGPRPAPVVASPAPTRPRARTRHPGHAAVTGPVSDRYDGRVADGRPRGRGGGPAGRAGPRRGGHAGDRPPRR